MNSVSKRISQTLLTRAYALLVDSSLLDKLLLELILIAN